MSVYRLNYDAISLFNNYSFNAHNILHIEGNIKIIVYSEVDTHQRGQTKNEQKSVKIELEYERRTSSEK